MGVGFDACSLCDVHGGFWWSLLSLSPVGYRIPQKGFLFHCHIPTFASYVRDALNMHFSVTLAKERILRA